MRPAFRKLLGISLLADVAFVAVGVLVWRGMQPSEEVAQLTASNPGWSVDTQADWLVLTENATQRRVVLPPDQAGPHSVRRVPCAEVARAYPAWFRVPGDSSESEPLACVHVAGPQVDAYVMNFLTALEIPALWDELYAPLVEQARRGAWGGHATGSRATPCWAAPCARRCPAPAARGRARTCRTASTRGAVARSGRRACTPPTSATRRWSSPASASLRRSLVATRATPNYSSTIVSKPPKNMRCASNGMVFISMSSRGSAITLALMASRSARER